MCGWKELKEGVGIHVNHCIPRYLEAMFTIAL